MSGALKYWSISSTEICYEAKKMGLKIDIVDREKNTFYVSSKEQKTLFKSTDFGGNSALGFKICLDKGLTYKILEKHGMPIAKSVYVSQRDFQDFNASLIQHLSFPVIIKPLSEAHGNGVMMNIDNYRELNEKLGLSFEKYKDMIIQEQALGDEVRVLVVKGEVILARNRIPASVAGDGNKNISELIDEENKNPLRGEGYESPLAIIIIDDELLSFMEKHKINMKDIPRKGEIVQLRGNSNIGTGGTMVNVTDKMHESTKKICINASKILGLEICGVDVLTSDISKPLDELGGIILEVNATPGLGGERELTGVNTAREILKRVFSL